MRFAGVQWGGQSALCPAIKRKSKANSKLYSEPCLFELGLLNAQHARNQRFAGSELVGRRTPSLRSPDELRFRPDVRSTIGVHLCATNWFSNCVSVGCNIVGNDVSNHCATGFIYRFHVRRADRAAGGCHRGAAKDLSCRAAYSRGTRPTDALLSEMDSRRPCAERTY